MSQFRSFEKVLRGVAVSKFGGWNETALTDRQPSGEKVVLCMM